MIRRGSKCEIRNIKGKQPLGYMEGKRTEAPMYAQQDVHDCLGKRRVADSRARDSSPSEIPMVCSALDGEVGTVMVCLPMPDGIRIARCIFGNEKELHV